MRSLLISFTVIIFCLSVNIVNTVDENYFTEKGRSLFGWSTDAPISTADLSVYNDSNINGTMNRYGDPNEQPTGLVNAGFLDDLQKKYDLLNLLVKTITYSTIRFHEFLYNFGRPNSSITVIPYYIGIPLSILVNINHILAIMQFIRGYNIENAT